MAAAHADNLCVVGVSVGGATRILDDAAQEFCLAWGPRVKEGSREAVEATGSAEVAPEDWWVRTTMAAVLGHIMSANGSTSLCVNHVIEGACRAFLASCGMRASCGLSVSIRLRPLCLARDGLLSIPMAAPAHGVPGHCCPHVLVATLPGRGGGSFRANAGSPHCRGVRRRSPAERQGSPASPRMGFSGAS